MLRGGGGRSAVIGLILLLFARDIDDVRGGQHRLHHDLHVPPTSTTPSTTSTSTSTSTSTIDDHHDHHLPYHRPFLGAGPSTPDDR